MKKLFDESGDDEKGYLLKNPEVEELSVVDEPAQGLARPVLRKRAASDLTRVLITKRLPYQAMPEGLVYGIAAVSTIDGRPYFDKQNDHIGTRELVTLAHKFMTDSRVGCVMHLRDPETGKPIVAGRVVESCVLTGPLQKALGIELPHGMEAWIVGMKIDNPAVLRACEQGEFSGFSIGGRGRRVEVAKMSIREQAAAIFAAYETARNNAPEKMERREDYLPRIAKQLGHDLTALEQDAAEVWFDAHKNRQRLQKRRDDNVRKGLVALDALIRQVQAERPGLSAAQSFAKAMGTEQGAALYRDLRRLGVDPGRVAEVSKAMADSSDEIGTDDPAGYYEPEDISEQAAARTARPDVTADSLVDNHNVGDAKADLLTISRTADRRQQESVAASSRNMRRPLSRPAAIAKAWADHPESYKRLKAAGMLDQCE